MLPGLVRYTDMLPVPDGRHRSRPSRPSRPIVLFGGIETSNRAPQPPNITGEWSTTVRLHGTPLELHVAHENNDVMNATIATPFDTSVL